MSSHTQFTCARCRRTLSVRSDYLGRWVACNHCEHAFLAQEHGASGLSASEACPDGPGDHRDEIQRLQDQISDLRRRVESVESLEGELQLVTGENARLATTVEVLKAELAERVAEMERLRRSAEELIATRAERDRGEAERRAFSALVDQLRNRLDDLEQSLAEAQGQYESARLDHLRQHEEVLGHWEAQRRALVSRGEEELRSVREEATRLREERDGLVARQSQWERTLEEVKNQHRTETDTLACELRQLREVDRRTPENQGPSSGELQDLQSEIETLRRELDTERRGHQEQSTALVHELDALYQDRLAAEQHRTAEELSSLQETLEHLGQERDEAIEQARQLQLDRDRLHEIHARLEARLQEIEQSHELADEPLTVESSESPVPAEALQEFAPEPDGAPLALEPGSLATALGMCDGSAPEPQETPGDLLVPDPPAVPEMEAEAIPSPGSETADSQDPLPPATSVASLPDGSPEARMQSLRDSLRGTHEGESGARRYRPRFRRLARIWLSGGAD